ncbi:MAG: hypothetical protein WCA77_04210 [Thermoplasmata archaeon]
MVVAIIAVSLTVAAIVYADPQRAASSSNGQGPEILSSNLTGVPCPGTTSGCFQGNASWSPSGYSADRINILVEAQATSYTVLTVGSVSASLPPNDPIWSHGSYNVTDGGTGIHASSQTPFSVTVEIYFAGLNDTS